MPHPHFDCVEPAADNPPPPACESCTFAMEQVALLPRTLNFPMQRVYHCAECRTVLTVTEA